MNCGGRWRTCIRNHVAIFNGQGAADIVLNAGVGAAVQGFAAKVNGKTSGVVDGNRLSEGDVICQIDRAIGCYIGNGCHKFICGGNLNGEDASGGAQQHAQRRRCGDGFYRHLDLG